MMNGTAVHSAPTPERALIYHRFARVYDAVFERMFRPRIEFGIGLLDLEPGHRVLDLGVGTGLSLAEYPTGVELIAVDIASGMLAEARQKADRFQGSKIHFARMDALDLAFPDDTFDAVFVSFVVSVVRDPARVMREIERVSKPGARVLVINHFRSQRRLLSSLEGLFNPFFVRLGWRSDLSVDELLSGSALEVHKIAKKEKIDLWTAILAENPGPNGSNGNGNGSTS